MASPPEQRARSSGGIMISLRNVSKRFDGSRGAAVNDLSLEIPEGETVVLVGPSGCGKTTTMRMINRLIEPTGGTITVDGRDVLRQDPVQLRRSIGYMIQDDFDDFISHGVVHRAQQLNHRTGQSFVTYVRGRTGPSAK